MPQGWDDTGQGRHRCARRLQKKQLEPRLDEAKAGQRVVFFVDAAHFVLAPYLGMLWCFVRQFIRAPAGRQRFNVLGALRAVQRSVLSPKCNTIQRSEAQREVEDSADGKSLNLCEATESFGGRLEVVRTSSFAVRDNSRPASGRG